MSFRIVRDEKKPSARCHYRQETFDDEDPSTSRIAAYFIHMLYCVGKKLEVFSSTASSSGSMLLTPPKAPVKTEALKNRAYLTEKSRHL